MKKSIYVFFCVVFSLIGLIVIIPWLISNDVMSVESIIVCASVLITCGIFILGKVFYKIYIAIDRHFND